MCIWLSTTLAEKKGTLGGEESMGGGGGGERDLHPPLNLVVDAGGDGIEACHELDQVGGV